MTYHHPNLLSYNSRGQNLEISFLKMLAGLVPSGSSRGESASLPFLASGGCRHSLALSAHPPVFASVLVSPPPPMTLTFFPPSSKILACDQISNKPEKYPHLKISKLVTSSKSLLPWKVTFARPWFQAMNILGNHYSDDPTQHLH